MFAVLHVPDFALHAVLRAEPGLEGRPAALFGSSKRKSLIVALNAAARSAGVEPGMTASQAVARCSRLLIRAPQPGAEVEACATLLALGFTLSPSIEDTAPGICTIDLKGTDPAGHIDRAAQAVDQLVRSGLPATAGIARTPLLALYAARACDETPSLARTPKSASQRVLKIADEKDFLTALPLAAADPSVALARVLAGWGLRTLGDLTALPRDEIVLRFGAEGLALWNRAAGGDTRPLKPVIPPQTFFAEREFEEEIETLEPLLFVLRRFLERISLELRAARQAAAELTLTLKLEDDTRHTRSFRLPEPTSDEAILFRAIHSHLESLQTEACISAVQLQIAPTRPLVRQQGLFETGLRDPHGFAETLARAVAIVGSDRVGCPKREDTHRPDAFKLVPPAAVIPPATEPAVHAPLGLPLRRFRPPLRVNVELTGEQPTYVWTEHVRGAIAGLLGPWFSSGDWWEKERAWRRTEWDIAFADDGGLYRLIRIGNTYYIEGEYD
jgi:protein ImuB